MGQWKDSVKRELSDRESQNGSLKKSQERIYACDFYRKA